MTIIIAMSVISPFVFVSFYENTSSYMIAYITGWYFFVLVNAYFGGAMTMFFSSEITIPFEYIKDVMKKYPDWKLLMKDGEFMVQVNYRLYRTNFAFT